MERILERFARLRSRSDLPGDLVEELARLEEDVVRVSRKQFPSQERESSRRLLDETFASDEFEPVALTEADDEPTFSSLGHVDVSEVSDAAFEQSLPVVLEQRYEDLGRIARGGMGEIRRVRDRDLNRNVIMKILRADRQGNRLALMRFIEEAQITAQLAHPGIPAVHEVGRFTDGRLYFTMREVRGRTLREVMTEVQDIFDGDFLTETDSGWNMRGLINALQDTCETLGFAHARGVVHRDLKPDNIMVGDFGEVQLLDWGIAKVAGRAVADDSDAPSPLESVDVNLDREATQAGTVMGTADYMAPEQVRGEIERIQPASDVFGLGVILYQMLTGTAPFTAKSTLEILLQILEGPRTPISEFDYVPQPLVGICQRALASEPSDRFHSARDMGDAIEDWLEGTARREQAVGILERSDALREEIDEMLETITWLDRSSRDQLKDIPPDAPVEHKEAAWQMQDRAQKLRRKLARREVEYVNQLRAVLNYAPDLDEPRRRLADYYRDQHEISERRGNQEDAEEMRAYLEAYDDGQYSDYLRGHGHLSLSADSDGASASLFQFQNQNRRLVPEFVCELGDLPLERVELALGSYLVRITAPDTITVDYPINIDREGQWSSTPPHRDEPVAVHLPAKTTVSAGECYVSAGWFVCGGDPRAPQSLDRKRVWIDGFVIQRFAVTHREYLLFLNSLVTSGCEDKALRHAPTRSGGVTGNFGPPAYDQNDAGLYMLPDDADIAADHPVTLIDWYGARAFAQWLRKRTKHPWSLPSEFEWEKAARGVDARLYPWGDFLDPTWCCMLDSSQVAHTTMSVQSFPVDESPYGVRGMAGNVRSWCREAYQPAEASPSVPSSLKMGRHETLSPTAGSENIQSQARVFRGGAWYLSSDQCRSSARDGSVPEARFRTVGIRLVRPVTN
jgi:serine/threonine-protein kinase